MTTIKNSTGSKAVNITYKDGSFNCAYVQRYSGEEQVLDFKTYRSRKMGGKKIIIRGSICH